MCSLSAPGKPAQPIWIMKAPSNQFSPFVLTAALPTRTSPPPNSRYFSTSKFLTHQHSSSPKSSTLPQRPRIPRIRDECSRSSLGCALCSGSYLDWLQLFFPTLPATAPSCSLPADNSWTLYSMVLSSSPFAEVVGSSTPLPTVQIPLILRPFLSCHPICEAISDALSLLDSWLSVYTSPQSPTVPTQLGLPKHKCFLLATRLCLIHLGIPRAWTQQIE